MNLSSPTRTFRRLFTQDDAHGDALILRLDNTALQLIQHCPTAAYNELVLGRTSLGRAPLDYGGALHCALESWQLHSNPTLALEALQTYWDKLPKYDMGWRTLTQACETFLAYVDHYKHPFILYEHDKTTWLERPFDLPLLSIDDPVMFRGFPRHSLIEDLRTNPQEDPNDTNIFTHSIQLRWTGRLDLLASINNEPILVDHKTCSIDSSAFYDSFYNAAQFSGYVWAAHQQGLTSLSKVLINTLITRAPTATGTSIDFARREYPRFAWHIDEWKSDVEASVHLFLDQLKRGSFTRNTGNCAGKYGRCDFFDSCMVIPSLREKVLSADSMFAERTWTPLH